MPIFDVAMFLVAYFPVTAVNIGLIFPCRKGCLESVVRELVAIVLTGCAAYALGATHHKSRA